MASAEFAPFALEAPGVIPYDSEAMAIPATEQSKIAGDDLFTNDLEAANKQTVLSRAVDFVAEHTPTPPRKLTIGLAAATLAISSAIGLERAANPDPVRADEPTPALTSTDPTADATALKNMCVTAGLTPPRVVQAKLTYPGRKKKQTLGVYTESDAMPIECSQVNGTNSKYKRTVQYKFQKKNNGKWRDMEGYGPVKGWDAQPEDGNQQASQWAISDVSTGHEPPKKWLVQRHGRKWQPVRLMMENSVKDLDTQEIVAVAYASHSMSIRPMTIRRK